MATETPKSHHQLRTWGYEICSEPDKFLIGKKSEDAESPDSGEHDTREVAAMCLESLAFPSDYFPLRILNELQKLADDAGEPRDDGRRPLLVLTARKMACLYQVLQQAGMNLSRYFDIVSDRFIFLQPNVNELKKRLENMSLEPDGRWKSIYLVDDLKRRGEQLKRRARNFEVHLTGATPAKDGRPKESALIDVRSNQIDAEHFRLVGEEDGAGMIRAYSRTFARALVPYFTDFPVSPILKFKAEEFSEVGDWLGGQEVYEVSSSVGIDENLRCYTLDATRLLTSDTEEGKRLTRLLEECCHTVKLRLFVQSPRKLGDFYQIRLVVKPICKSINAKNLLACARTSELLPENPTYHQLGQCFGYLEYLLSWYSMRELVNMLPSVVRDAFDGDVIDEEFARVVLGNCLYKKACDDLDGSLLDILEQAYQLGQLPNDQDGQSSKNAGRSSVAVLGDDVVEIVDSKISTYTRGERNKIGVRSSRVVASAAVSVQDDAINGDWKRLNFESILKHPEIEWKDPANERNSFVLGLALDILTDWGKLVPDQQAVRTLGNRPEEVISRLKSFENSDEVRIERCFRAGEITAKISATTLTGGCISISQTSFKKEYIGCDRNSSDSKLRLPRQSPGNAKSACSTLGKTKKWDLLKLSKTGEQDKESRKLGASRGKAAGEFQEPYKLVSDLLEVVDQLPEWISRASQKRGLKTASGEYRQKLEDVRAKYLKLPCPVVIGKQRVSEEIEYAGELLRYFNAISEEAYRQMHTSLSKIDGDSADDTVDQYIAAQVDRQLTEWTSRHDLLREMGRPWSFGALRRLKRAYLALDTLFAVICPLFCADDADCKKCDASELRLISQADLFRQEELPEGLSNDVWEDWVQELNGSPVPLRFSETDRLLANHSWHALAVVYRDLLGDLWHALVHASMALLLEIESEKPFESHRWRLHSSILRLDEAIQKRLNTRIRRRLRGSKGLKKLVEELGGLKLSYSPFGDRDSLYTEQQVVQRQWEFRSGGRWARLGRSELRHLVDSGRLIEVIDWQGLRRYPSFQFVPLCLREGLRVSRQGDLMRGLAQGHGGGLEFTDRDFPFLRRDVSLSMMSSSRAVSGWNAALWYHSMLSRVGEASGAVDNYFPSKVGYRGLLFREALSQKGLWVDDWLGGGEALLQSERMKPEFLSSLCDSLDVSVRVLYRLTEAKHPYPNYWASAAPFEDQLDALANYKEQTLTERAASGEPEFPPGRFDPGKNPNGGVFYGALYLSRTVRGCVLEVYDRRIATTLEDVMSKKVYEYEVRRADAGSGLQYINLESWPALVSATPIRSTTQAIANFLCYDTQVQNVPMLPKVICYPLRTALDGRGWVLFEPTSIGKDGRMATAVKGGDPQGTANHDVGDGFGGMPSVSSYGRWLAPSRAEAPCSPGEFTDEFWTAVASLRTGPRDSAVCFRRFPTRALDEKDTGGPVF